MEDWANGIDVVELASSLFRDGAISQARTFSLLNEKSSLPTVEPSQTIELLEAIFLEERKPVVVFDAEQPEAITVRLLIAFWPSFRRNFAVTTFALSPRSISGRSFDLIFSSKDARSRFSDWEGRKIDVKKEANPRHRWTVQIAERVFGAEWPSLVKVDALGELTSGGGEADLRVSLLWNELHAKLQSSPNAALGLLDIANSRSKRNLDAIRTLEPALADAARRAVVQFSPTDAWRFLYALTEKLREFRLNLSAAKVIRAAAINLAAGNPDEALANIPVVSSGKGRQLLLGAIGEGLSKIRLEELGRALAKLPPSELLHLLINSASLTEATLPRLPEFSEPLASEIEYSTAAVQQQARRHLLRYLTSDEHAPLAKVLFPLLDEQDLLNEAKWLAQINGYASEELAGLLIDRAAQLEQINALRDFISEVEPGPGVDSLLSKLVGPSKEGLAWLVGRPELENERKARLISGILSELNWDQLRSIAAYEAAPKLLQLLALEPALNIGLIDTLVRESKQNNEDVILAILKTIPHASGDIETRLSRRTVEALLPQEWPDRRAIVQTLLAQIGPKIDISNIIRVGLAKTVPGNIAAANIEIFNCTPPDTRIRFLKSVEEFCRALTARGTIDYGNDGSEHAAAILWDAAIVNPAGFVKASSLLLPFLMKSVDEPAGPLIAAAFPPVYQELKKADEAPDFLRFFLFVDWDKCKVARRDLVDQFLISNWRGTDIALAASRAGDVARILRRIKKMGGSTEIMQVEESLTSIPEPWRSDIAQAIKNI
ncbi:hypothetical protein G6L72_22930 [Agrobacterium rubi]|uniref:HEAT repeat domain-containing protein n=2 Tax=Agrobacterium rubi TaxID=28099 RepID=A0ABX2J9P0_9HYPH|nr:hypothetical protein [Agrobacterium rubi]NTF39560.1 hypothetical protein [Agrobacterium rubi]